MRVLLQSMKNATNVVEKNCGALYWLAHGYKNVNTPSPWSEHFQNIVESLLNIIRREDAGSSRLRTAAYDTLNEVVRCSNDEVAKIVFDLLEVVINELKSTLEVRILSSDTRERSITNYKAFFAVAYNATVHEEAMLAIGALAHASGPNFAKYMQNIYTHLEVGLQNFEEYPVCAVTVGVVGDICRALEDKVLSYSDEIMTQLLNDLSNN
ncbi:hypothetical protein RD792_013039 [Penstemon davidsonii]|uniref:Importin subunit beta-1/Transportin-1-like TPR repeats domain-containing protein n=1 Tax=Penstemon davidsonii TaxID=160366 RepID=A0ABR0CSC2_9LAMI|nr:hypothetical protein RD792_013039 [Penstemon davidsonii]